MQQSFEQKPKRWPYILFVVVLGVGILGFIGYRFLGGLTPERLIGSGIVNRVLVNYAGQENKDLIDLIPEFLGFEEPKTYLLLFLNNTEIRPGGGFIGVYATVRVEDGHTEILALDGTEVLDAGTPESWQPEPPAPIREHLGLDRWYFRDSNWSPDFAESSERALLFYAAEGGVAADEVDAVIGVTPTVLERLMEITGPFTIQGITFTSENVTETLEYEVEFGFRDRGIAVIDRKQIIEPFFEALIDHMKDNLFTRADTYLDTIESLADERHILMYGVDEGIEDVVDARGWAGKVQRVDGDFLMWVDANLAALKTDHAIDRSLTYDIRPREDGRYIARATMTYNHTQPNFDWRTTRYRTYARVFVPAGAELISADGVMQTDRSSAPGRVDEGQELGKQWFGGFISIEPGDTGALSFEYLLPEDISAQISNGSYTLYAQKQAGTIDPGLTLDLDFGTTIKQAEPAETEDRFGDARYQTETDLRVDRTVDVSL